jgi:hypothetical protein
MILPDKQDRGIVVFWVWPSLAYRIRVMAAFLLIAGGLLMQFASRLPIPGVFFLAVGNLLLLVKGYDNRIDSSGFDAGAEWERVEPERLAELKELDARIRRWDRSSLEVSNPLGLVVFVVIVAPLAALVYFRGTPTDWMLAIDAVVLLVPHWITGIRRALRAPKLLVRIETIEAVLERAERRLEDHKVTLLMLLAGGDTKLPEDLKFKVDLEGHHPDFLGLYGQVVLNEVQGTSYPYFYVVLVAKDGFGLHEAFRHYWPDAKKITKEFKRQDKVEVMVIRQHTTKKSGYHTKQQAAYRVFVEGLVQAEKVAVRGAGAGV